jgi:signal transduction histidine kinase/CheY-like chemotaxis protein
MLLHKKSIPVRWILLVTLLSPCVPVTGAHAQENSATAQTPLRRPADYWELPEAEKKATCPVDFSVTVAYCDPEWGLFWGEDEGIPFFLPAVKGTLSAKTGQNIRIQGTISAEGLRADPLKTKLLPSLRTIKYANIEGLLDKADSFNGKPCSLELLVDSQEEVDARHVLLTGVAQGYRIHVRLYRSVDEEIPDFEEAYLGAKGVFVRSYDASRKLSTIDFWVGTQKDLSLRSWLSTDPRFDQAAVTIESLRGSISRSTPVKIVGRVQSQIPGKSLTIRDETGQLIVESAQLNLLKPGELIEALGLPDIDGVNILLRQAVYRRQAEGNLAASAQPAIALPRLRLIDQVRQLSPEQARLHYPVKLYAVVTWADPDADFFYAQDSSGGIRVQRTANNQEPLRKGSLVDIEGKTIPGNIIPSIQARHIEQHASIALPASEKLSLEQAQTGIGEAKLVEMEGLVRQLRQTGRWLRLKITTPSGEFAALLPSSENPASLQDAVVRVRGVCSSMLDENRHFAGLELWTTSTADFQILGALPENPFSLPNSPIAKLKKADSLLSEKPWVKTNGIVTYHHPGHYLYIQEGRVSLKVMSRSDVHLIAGERAEIVGLPGLEYGSFILREAFVRSLGKEKGIQPISPEIGQNSVNEDLDGQLVRLRGEVLDCTLRPDGTTLLLRSGSLLFEATLEQPVNQAGPTLWPEGTQVTLCGVYELERNEFLKPDKFHLRLRSAADIVVEKTAPWWTPQKAVAAVFGLGLLGFLAAAWILLLRRQVRSQTRIIRTQLEKEARMTAELERSSRFESLGTMAGGIAHDFNNILTIIIGNLSLARIERSLEADTLEHMLEAEKGAQRARSLAQQLLTFARGGSPLRKAHDIRLLLRDACEECIQGANIDCSFDFQPDLWSSLIDRDQISQALHNLIANAVQAMPQGGGLVLQAKNLSLGNDEVPSLPEGKYVRVAISDSGPGISPENVSKVFDPYFSTKGAGRGLGLATVRSIIRKHNGAVEVLSTPGKGCTFVLYIPASEEKPVQGDVKGAANAKVPGLSHARVLFMDDEASIRMIAAHLFKRMGCECSLAGDGSEALSLFRKALDDGRPFDLVVTDLTVPKGMGGEELMERLKVLDAGVRVIVSSGYSGDPIMSRFSDFGFIGCVPKPYEIEDLEKAVRAALAQPQAGGHA